MQYAQNFFTEVVPHTGFTITGNLGIDVTSEYQTAIIMIVITVVSLFYI